MYKVVMQTQRINQVSVKIKIHFCRRPDQCKHKIVTVSHRIGDKISMSYIQPTRLLYPTY